MTPEELITKARSRLVIEQPFFGVLLLRLKMVEIPDEDPTFHAMATDGTCIYYKAKWVMEVTKGNRIEILKGVLAHEVMHVAMQHPFREGDREHDRFNRACDYAINDILLEAGFRLPDDVLHHAGYKDMSSEHVYTMLPPDPPGGTGGSNDPNGGATPQWGGVIPAKSQDGKSVKQQGTDWKIATHQAAESAKIQGALPGNLEELILDLVDNRVDWTEVLRHFMTSFSKNDYSWKRPNYRFLSSGFYFPTLHSEAVGEMAVFIDTSGSVSSDELAQFKSEINAIASDMQPEKIHLLYVDTRVAKHEEFTPDDFPMEMKFPGRGGTCFKPGFEYLEEHDINPVCVVYLTDMECNSFPEPPPYDVLWISTTKREEAPFGEVIRMY